MVDFNQINNYNLHGSSIQAQNLQSLINKQRFIQQQKESQGLSAAAQTEISPEARMKLEKEKEVDYYKNLALAMDEEMDPKVEYYQKLFQSGQSVEVTDDILNSLVSNAEFMQAIGL